MSLGLLDLLLVAGIASCCATVCIFVGRLFSPPNKLAQTTESIVFIFTDGDIVDMSDAASVLLQKSGFNDLSLGAVIDLFAPSFPNLQATLDTQLDGPVTLSSDDGSATFLSIQPYRETLRLTVGQHSEDCVRKMGTLRFARESAELADLRDIVKNAPTMMWRSDENGQTQWANDSYFEMADACRETENGLPCLAKAPLFSELDSIVIGGKSTNRCSLQKSTDDTQRWFDVTTHRTDRGTFHYANDADHIVRAELAQRKFKQTLSQTFAQLSIGLAIFDHRQQLNTFNPAILDMTRLSFEFLSGRPTLNSILDRLRESRMLPEPKDYSSWRDQFTQMENMAKDGTYSENWNLPDGQTFRVTSRPHPDGAFALLFEDISAEISLTRRFRSEIETSQAVLDHFDDAVVVFSSGGHLVLANAAYSDLWGTDLTNGLAHFDLRIEIRKWQDRCTPTRIWTNLREFSDQIGRRVSWQDSAIMDDGRHITCQADPISNGMTLIRFRFDKPVKPTIQKLTQVDPTLMIAKR